MMEEEDDDEESDDEPLHWVDCNETEEDMDKMRRTLARNPLCLNSQAMDNSNSTPLYRAVSYGHPSCVAFLLQAGADPELDSPTSSVHISIFGETSTMITKMLLKSGASANAEKSMNKCAYIVSACRVKATETVRLLLDYGALTEDLHYLQYLRNSGEMMHTFLLDTPLAIAALEGDLDLFRLLLVRGALPTISATEHGVSEFVQDAHNVPRLVAHECRSGDQVRLRILRTFHLFGGDPMQRLRNGDTPYTKYKTRNESLKKLAIELSSSVRPLVDICRLSIFRTIGRDYCNKVQELRGILPKTLCDFLKFPEPM